MNEYRFLFVKKKVTQSEVGPFLTLNQKRLQISLINL